MHWIKHVIVDILSLLLILLFCITNNSGLGIAVWIYTGILLFGKILSLFVNYLQSKSTNKEVPTWFYHTIYFFSVLPLFIYQQYYLGGAWFLIWILSSVDQIKQTKANLHAKK